LGYASDICAQISVATGLSRDSQPTLREPPKMPQIASSVVSIEPKGPIVRKNPAKVFQGFVHLACFSWPHSFFSQGGPAPTGGPMSKGKGPAPAMTKGGSMPKVRCARVFFFFFFFFECSYTTSSILPGRRRSHSANRCSSGRPEEIASAGALRLRA
jgi:hypothetical protein